MRTFKELLLTGVLCLAHPYVLWADIETNFTSAADTALFEPNPAYNLGGLPDFPVGLTAGIHGDALRLRGLIRFDLTSLPTNALITAAELTVNAVRQAALNPGSVVSLHRLLVSWGEGTSASSAEGAPAKPGEATWLNRLHPSTPWASPGGAAGLDYVASFSATNSVRGLGTFVFQSTPELVANVQAWVNLPQTNFGWMVRDLVEQTVGTGRRFASRESQGGNAPRLTVQYLLPTGPAPFSLGEVEVLGSQFSFSFEAQSNSTYAVEIRDSLGAGSWRTLTNIASQALPRKITITDTVSGGSALYRVRSPN
jgi:hypothetical protein